MLFRQLVGDENFLLAHPKGQLGSASIAGASTGNGAGSSAVLSRTVPVSLWVWHCFTNGIKMEHGI